ARLRVADEPVDAQPQLQADLRDLGRLARSRLTRDDDDLVIADRLRDLLAVLDDRQLRRVLEQRGPRGARGPLPRPALLVRLPSPAALGALAPLVPLPSLGALAQLSTLAALTLLSTAATLALRSAFVALALLSAPGRTGRRLRTATTASAAVLP